MDLTGIECESNDLRIMEIRIKENLQTLERARREMKRLEYFRVMIGSLNNCNECGNNECGIKPNLGEWIRYNCYKFEEEK